MIEYKRISLHITRNFDSALILGQQNARDQNNILISAVREAQSFIFNMGRHVNSKIYIPLTRNRTADSFVIYFFFENFCTRTLAPSLQSPQKCPPLSDIVFSFLDVLSVAMNCVAVNVHFTICVLLIFPS